MNTAIHVSEGKKKIFFFDDVPILMFTECYYCYYYYDFNNHQIRWICELERNNSHTETEMERLRNYCLCTCSGNTDKIQTILKKKQQKNIPKETSSSSPSLYLDENNKRPITYMLYAWVCVCFFHMHGFTHQKKRNTPKCTMYIKSMSEWVRRNDASKYNLTILFDSINRVVMYNICIEKQTAL